LRYHPSYHDHPPQAAFAEPLDTTNKAADELPGILNWPSQDGAGSPSAAISCSRAPRSTQCSTRGLGQPYQAFLRERCEIGPFYTVGVDEIFRLGANGCTEQGQDHPGTKQTWPQPARGDAWVAAHPTPRWYEPLARLSGVGLKDPRSAIGPHGPEGGRDAPPFFPGILRSSALVRR